MRGGLDVMERVMATFDEYAVDYEAALGQGLAATGEDSVHFARARVRWLARCLDRLDLSPRRILDYGCGTGGSIAPLLDLRSTEHVVGADTSQESLAVAATRHSDPRVSFRLLAGPDAPAARGLSGLREIDLVFTNGVLHHIRPERRPEIIRGLAETLRPGGLICIWENNLLNPGTRVVMSRIPFDRDAMPLGAGTTRRLLVHAGIVPLSTHYLFIFPRMLRWLRPLEPLVARLPLGGQYQVLGRLPSSRPGEQMRRADARCGQVRRCNLSVVS